MRHLTEITTQTANFMVRLKENGLGFLTQVVMNTSVILMVLRKSTVFIDISFNCCEHSIEGIEDSIEWERTFHCITFDGYSSHHLS